MHVIDTKHSFIKLISKTKVMYNTLYNVLLEDMDCSELLHFLYIRILLTKHLALPKMKTTVPTVSPLLDVVINIFYYFYTINSTLALSVSKKRHP